MLFVLALIVSQLLVYVAVSRIAHRKGYRWLLWIFVGAGWLALPILLLMPAANQPGLPLEVQQRRQHQGNRLGAVLTGLTFAVLLGYQWYRAHR